MTHPDGTGATVVPVADCSQCPLFGPSHPTWTRDGRFIAVTGLMQGNGYFNGGVALTYFDTSKPTKPVKAVAPLGTLDAAGWAAFSPDGSRLAYRDVQPKTTDYLQC